MNTRDKVDEVIDLIAGGHWNRTNWAGVFKEGRRYCVLGAAGQAWHEDPFWFEDIGTEELDYRYRNATETERTEADDELELIEALNDRLLDRFGATPVPSPVVGSAAMMPLKDACMNNQVDTVLLWNDHIAENEAAVIEMLEWLREQ